MKTKINPNIINDNKLQSEIQQLSNEELISLMSSITTISSEFYFKLLEAEILMKILANNIRDEKTRNHCLYLISQFSKETQEILSKGDISQNKQ